MARGAGRAHDLRFGLSMRRGHELRGGAGIGRWRELLRIIPNAAVGQVARRMCESCIRSATGRFKLCRAEFGRGSAAISEFTDFSTDIQPYLLTQRSSNVQEAENG